MMANSSYRAQYATGIYALGLIVLLVYCIDVIKRAEVVRTILRFFGRYSLELYLLHVAMWGILAAMGWPMFMLARYFTMIGIAILLAPWLSRLSNT